MAPAAHASRSRADLVGAPVFWAALGVTLCAGVPFALFRVMRPWIGCAVISENQPNLTRWYSLHVTPPTRTVQRFHGPTERATVPAARRARWWCWSVAH